ncbi:DUF4350 domain-containing protein [Enteractinococcus fodinae]|uniref:DUF4350 domain-containing protein n=1 Tax=Enteractinococcus fodinae TaxID=684663 RepID=A0ABU2AZE3_9MICC|nr:hypothetical protein [Enteractinococcus fodinae]MDR7346722.1 hypothetical protein [Enteractinococcus fodinae]
MIQRRRKLGLIVLVVATVAAWLAVMIWLAFQPHRDDGNLGLDDETGPGAAAITNVLEDHGIAVRPAQSMTQLQSELDRNPDATVLIHDKYHAMDSASYERLQDLDSLIPPDQRVYAGVSERQRQFLLDGVETTMPLGFEEHLEVEATCQLEAAREAGDISNIRHGVVLTDDAYGCFSVVDEATDATAYAFAHSGDGSVIFADWRMLSNSGLHDNGTATLATWSLGRSDTVIWFQPNFQFDPDPDGQLSPVQLPDWVRMGIVWAVIVTGIYLFYRGRRTGPVITEPLPAEVPAAETTVGRGRLYARAKHHHHAMTTLQRASLARLARLLQLGPRTPDDTVLAETAKQLGMPLQQIQALYTPPRDRLSSAQFVTWSKQLHDLEATVRHRYSTPSKESS